MATKKPMHFPSGQCPLLANGCSLLEASIGRRVGGERTRVPQPEMTRDEPAELAAAIVALRRVTTNSLLCASERRAAAAYAELLESALPSRSLRSVPPARRSLREEARGSRQSPILQLIRSD